jgi:hypothetical protein
MPTALQALPHEARNPLEVHGCVAPLLWLLVRMPNVALGASFVL